MKKWYASRTLWVNLIAAVALFVQNQYGYAIDPMYQAYILMIVNGALRLITHTELSV